RVPPEMSLVASAIAYRRPLPHLHRCRRRQCCHLLRPWCQGQSHNTSSDNCAALSVSRFLLSWVNRHFGPAFRFSRIRSLWLDATPLNRSHELTGTSQLVYLLPQRCTEDLLLRARRHSTLL